MSERANTRYHRAIGVALAIFFAFIGVKLATSSEPRCSGVKPIVASAGDTGWTMARSLNLHNIDTRVILQAAANLHHQKDTFGSLIHPGQTYYFPASCR